MTRPICFLMKAQKPTQAQLEAGNYPKDKLAYRGLTITIENKAGTVRSGVGPGGKPWETKMVNDYGYVNGSMGVDGDQVDCYIGPDDGAENVYVVHQRKAGDWSKYDEDKVMIGFPSEAAAVAAFKKHYDDPRFLGPVTAMPFDDFKPKVLATKEKPSMIKSAVLFFKSLVPTHTRRLKSGKVVQVQAFENNRASRHALSAGEKGRQGSLFDELHDIATKVSGGPAKEVPALLKPAKNASSEDQVHAGLAAKFNEVGDGFELRNPAGNQWAVLMPDPSSEGKYRYQVFGETGLKEHRTFDNQDAALRGAIGAGFVEPDAGAMERMAPKWAEKFADPEVQAAATKHGDRTSAVAGDPHPAPVPKLALSGLAESDLAKWIDLHRQQHEAHYKDLAKVKKDLEGARSKRNKAETAYNEAAHEHGKAIEARAKGYPGGERAEEYAAWANRANDEYRKHRENVDRLSNSHAALVDRIGKLGKEKDKLVPGSGDIRMDFAAMRPRSDAEEAEHAKWAAGQYKAAKPAKVVSVKSKAEKGASLRSISAEYHPNIPIGKILDSVRKDGFEPVQEDGTPWEGMLMGADGRTSIELKGSKKGLHVQWHKMGSGRYEVNAYLM